MPIEKMNLQPSAEDPSPADSNPSTESPKTPPATPPAAEPKLFSEDYVKSLRSEAAENRVKAKQMKEAIEKVFGIEVGGDITEALTAVKVGYETKLADTQKSVRALHLNTNEVNGKNREALEKILQNAKLSGDTLATKAVLKEGYERGWTPIVEACLNVNPSLRESYQKVDEFDKMFGDRRSAEVKFAERVTLSGVNF